MSDGFDNRHNWRAASDPRRAHVPIAGGPVEREFWEKNTRVPVERSATSDTSLAACHARRKERRSRGRDDVLAK